MHRQSFTIPFLLLLAIGGVARADAPCRIEGTRVRASVSVLEAGVIAGDVNFDGFAATLVHAGSGARGHIVHVSSPLEFDAIIGEPVIGVSPFLLRRGAATDSGVSTVRISTPGYLERVRGDHARFLAVAGPIRVEARCDALEWGVGALPTQTELASSDGWPPHATSIWFRGPLPVFGSPSPRGALDTWLVGRDLAASIVERRGAYARIVGGTGFLRIEGWVARRRIREVSAAVGIGSFGRGGGGNLPATPDPQAQRSRARLRPGVSLYCDESTSAPCAHVREALNVEVWTVASAPRAALDRLDPTGCPTPGMGELPQGECAWSASFSFRSSHPSRFLRDGTPTFYVNPSDLTPIP